MNHKEKLDLKKLVSEMDAEDNTEHIRKVKHSVFIRNDIRKIEQLKQKYTSYTELLEQAQNECTFLFANYTDIFHKVVKGEIDLTIMTKLLTVLKLIEDGNVDQHEGSVMVGKILKELYIDSAIKRADNLDKERKEGEEREQQEEEQGQCQEPRNLKWEEWKLAKEIMYGSK